MKLKENLLILINIKSSSEYKSEREVSTNFALFFYTSSFSTLLLLLSFTLIDSFSFYYNMSQYSSINFEQVIR